MAILTRKATEGEKKYFREMEYWECGVSRFEHMYPSDETCVVYEGAAEISCDGQPVTLEPGILAFFPKGSNCVWNVIRPIKKYFR